MASNLEVYCRSLRREAQRDPNVNTGDDVDPVSLGRVAIRVREVPVKGRGDHLTWENTGKPWIRRP